MSLYTELEQNLLYMLQSYVLLGAVKTFETDLRECLFTGDKMCHGYRPEELPAINVTAQLKPDKTSPFTAGEVQHLIPITVVIVTKAMKKKDAAKQAMELQQSVLRVINSGRKSGNLLGANALVMGEVAASWVVVEDKPHSFAIATVEADVLKVVDL